MFQLPEEEMRKLGYQVIDTLVDHFSNMREKRASNTATYEELKEKISNKLPLHPEDPAEVLKEVNEFVANNIVHTGHPRFFSFIPGPHNFISVLGDTLASGYNVFVGHWMAGSGPAMIESILIRWLNDLYDHPAEAGGLLLSGGSMANLTAIATARNIKMGEDFSKATIYYSEQTHSSMAKGLRVLGFRSTQMRMVGVDEDFKIDIDDLKNKIIEDKNQGLIPLCIVGNAGTTNTGSVDDLVAISALSKEHDMWFHVDGAYGAAAILSEEYKGEIEGIQLADSLTIDPHKWWFQPFEIGCLLVRNRLHLKNTFNVQAEYLFDTILEEEEINFYDYGVQLTRSFRALKFYLSLRTYGLEKFSQAVDIGIKSAEFVEKLLREKSHWQIVYGAQLGVINFRYYNKSMSDKELDRFNKKISDHMMEKGYAMIITTILNGIKVLRMCPIHPETTEEDLRKTVEMMDGYVGANHL